MPVNLTRYAVEDAQCTVSAMDWYPSVELSARGLPMLEGGIF